MKRSVEEHIMFSAVEGAGFEVSNELATALKEGLRQIRIANHEFNTERKRKYREYLAWRYRYSKPKNKPQTEPQQQPNCQ